MVTRYIFTSKPMLYHANGLKVTAQESPSENSMKYFINGILADAFVKPNLGRKHRCSAMCGKPIQLLVGYPHSFDLASSVPG